MPHSSHPTYRKTQKPSSTSTTTATPIRQLASSTSPTKSSPASHHSTSPPRLRPSTSTGLQIPASAPTHTAISGPELRLLPLLRHPLWSRSLASMRKYRGRSTAPSRKTRSLPRSWDPIRIQKQWNHHYVSLGAGYWECCSAWRCLHWHCSSDWALLEAHITTPPPRQQWPLRLLHQLRPRPLLQLLVQLLLQLAEARWQALLRLQLLPFLPAQTLQQLLQLAPLQYRPFLTSQADPAHPQQPQRLPAQQ